MTMPYEDWAREIAHGCGYRNGLACMLQGPHVRCQFIGCPRRPDAIPNLEDEIAWLKERRAWQMAALEDLKKLWEREGL